MESVELYNRLTPGRFVIVAFKLGLGLLVGGAALVGMARGRDVQSMLPWLAVAGALIGFGLMISPASPTARCRSRSPGAARPPHEPAAAAAVVGGHGHLP